MSFSWIASSSSTPVQPQEIQSSKQGRPCAWLEQHYTFVRCHASVTATVRPLNFYTLAAHDMLAGSSVAGPQTIILQRLSASRDCHVCCRCTASGSLQKGAAPQCNRWRLRASPRLTRSPTA